MPSLFIAYSMIFVGTALVVYAVAFHKDKRYKDSNNKVPSNNGNNV